MEATLSMEAGSDVNTGQLAGSTRHCPRDKVLENRWVMTRENLNTGLA